MGLVERSPLGRLVAPMAPDAFLKEYWEHRPLHVARAQPDHFASLLRLADVERAVTSLRLSHPDIFVANAASPVEMETYTYANKQIDVARIAQKFADGGTIVVNQLERWVPSLAEFCRALEDEVSTRFQANVYFTPKNAQGLKAHYDSHDVFVAQVHGSKHWVIYDTPVELPFRGQGFVRGKHTPGAVTMEFDLHPGDMVYIPRGIMHDAVTTKVDSLHVTFGALQTSWTEVLLEAVARVALTDPDFRKSLPAGFARAGFDRASAAKTFQGLLQRVAERADFDGALQHFADDFLSTRVPLLPDQLAQVRRLDEVSPKSRVGVRPNVACRVQEHGESVVVLCYGVETRLPAHTRDALEFALTHEDFVVGALPGELDDDGKVVLVRQLLREGLVRLLS